jgi:hypothetical protein
MDPKIKELIDLFKNASPNTRKAFAKAVGLSSGEEDDSTNKKVANEDELNYTKKTLEIELERQKVLERTASLVADVEKKEQLQYENLKKQTQLRAQTVEEYSKLQEDIVKAEKGELQNIQAYDEQTQNMLLSIQKEAEIRKEIKEMAYETKNSLKDSAKQMAGFIGIGDKYRGSGLQKMINSIEAMGQEGQAGAAAAVRLFTNELKTLFSLQNIGLNAFNFIFGNTKAVMKSYDNAQASLAAATATTGKYNNVLYETQRGANMLDVSMQDVASALSTLNAETSEFASLNESTQLQLATVTVEMEKLKVSSADTAKFVENAFKIMNMGATEAIQVQKELAMAGADVGIGADKIIKQYNSASKVLAVYGRQSIGVFKDLAA